MSNCRCTASASIFRNPKPELIFCFKSIKGNYKSRIQAILNCQTSIWAVKTQLLLCSLLWHNKRTLQSTSILLYNVFVERKQWEPKNRHSPILVQISRKRSTPSGYISSYCSIKVTKNQVSKSRSVVLYQDKNWNICCDSIKYAFQVINALLDFLNHSEWLMWQTEKTLYTFYSFIVSTSTRELFPRLCCKNQLYLSFRSLKMQCCCSRHRLGENTHLE